MIYVQPAKKWNPLDVVAAKRLREEGDGSPVSWLIHCEWWFAVGWMSCWFAVTPWRRRVGYVRVNKGNVVSVAIAQEYRAGGIALSLLQHIRKVYGQATLYANIKHENTASVELFKKAGYWPYGSTPVMVWMLNDPKAPGVQNKVA